MYIKLKHAGGFIVRLPDETLQLGASSVATLPPKLSSTQECDKNRHLKYVKASVEKKVLKN